jgi:hypothetical protein
MQFDSNIKNVVNRLVQAYGQKTVKSMCDQIGISVSVVANRIQRNTFPYDLIVKCVLETGADLKWLCTGEGEPNIDGIKTEKKSIELSSEALEKLERIAALKNSGAITDDEYQLLKASIFNK